MISDLPVHDATVTPPLTLHAFATAGALQPAGMNGRSADYHKPRLRWPLHFFNTSRRGFGGIARSADSVAVRPQRQRGQHGGHRDRRCHRALASHSLVPELRGATAVAQGDSCTDGCGRRFTVGLNPPNLKAGRALVTRSAECLRTWLRGCSGHTVYCDVGSPERLVGGRAGHSVCVR
jgi:hypothetical protein